MPGSAFFRSSFGNFCVTFPHPLVVWSIIFAAGRPLVTSLELIGSIIPTWIVQGRSGTVIFSEVARTGFVRWRSVGLEGVKWDGFVKTKGVIKYGDVVKIRGVVKTCGVARVSGVVNSGIRKAGYC